MIIAILSLGGAILGATTIAGVLMLYEIRATTNSINSAKAIFAADSGINWALYSYINPPAGAQPAIANGVTITTICYDGTSAVVGCDDPTAVTAISSGQALDSRRTFILDLTSATTTFP